MSTTEVLSLSNPVGLAVCFHGLSSHTRFWRPRIHAATATPGLSYLKVRRQELGRMRYGRQRTCCPCKQQPTVHTATHGSPALSRIFLAQSGDAYVQHLAQPPPKAMTPCEPTSVTAHEATAYATWLEAACEACTQGATSATAQPIQLMCPGLSTALGPARWLCDCGFRADESGLTSAL